MNIFKRPDTGRMIIINMGESGCSKDVVIHLDSRLEDGQLKHNYSFWFGLTLLFQSDHYWTPYFWSEEKVILDLINWLTIKPGDTEQEHFKDYTPVQLAWLQSFDCELLKVWALDQEYR